MAWKFPKYIQKFPDSFIRGPKKASWKVFRWPGQFPGGLDNFLMAWTVSKRPEQFRMAWNVYRWAGKFPDGLDSFQMAWQVSRLPEMSTDGLESFQMA